MELLCMYPFFSILFSFFFQAIQASQKKIGAGPSLCLFSSYRFGSSLCTQAPKHPSTHKLP